jgi:hypothetical protein
MIKKKKKKKYLRTMLGLTTAAVGTYGALAAIKALKN